MTASRRYDANAKTATVNAVGVPSAPSSMPPPGAGASYTSGPVSVPGNFVTSASSLPRAVQASSGSQRSSRDAFQTTGGGSFTHSPPTVMGKYELFASLGRGGMAQVFLARSRGSLGIDKLVVVKKLRADDAASSSLVDMFLDEARLAARINHPNVVVTYDVGREDLELFIAMEYLEGQSLQRVLATARAADSVLAPQMAARMMSDALAGLHHAHELRDFDGSPLGVVHRDVSPQNIFVTYDGCVKILDFGIAKAKSSQETQAEVVKGKIGYMAPEHALGVPVDRRADIFAAGIVLWELLTGRTLLGGCNAVASLMRLLNEKVPRVSSVISTIDPELDDIVAKALARQPGDRFQTALEMRTAIEGYIARTSRLREEDVALWMRTVFAVEHAAEAERNMHVMGSPGRRSSHPNPPPQLDTPSFQPARTDDGLAVPSRALLSTAAPPRPRQQRVVLACFLGGAAIGLAALGLARTTGNRIGILENGNRAGAAMSPQALVSPPALVPSTLPLATNVHVGAPAVAPATPATPAAAAALPPSPLVEVAAEATKPARPPAAAKGWRRARRVAAAPAPSKPVATAAPAGVGYLTLDTYPWTRVSIAGKFVGSTPLVKLALPAGSYVLSLDNPEQNVHQTVTVTVPKGDVVSKRFAYR